MKKYLAYYETEWPANIAELTAVENKPFVGYLKGTKDVKYTVIPATVDGPADNEIWYTSSDGNIVTPYSGYESNVSIVDNIYLNGQGVITFDGEITSMHTFFEECLNLESVILPSKIDRISFAFEVCPSLVSVTIPDSIEYLGQQTFNQCDSLKDIYYTGTISQWNNIQKVSLWNGQSKPFTVHCTDGDIVIPDA